MAPSQLTLCLQFGTDTGYFPASSHAAACHYVAPRAPNTSLPDHSHF